MKREAALLAAVALAILGALGIADRIDRWGDEQAARRDDYRAWVADACTPARAGETAVAVRDATRITCTIYTRRAPGFDPIVASAAVMEVPQ